MQIVDYRKFRLNKINSPEFKHIKLLIFWPIFGLIFLLLERFYPATYHPISSSLDSVIPFCEFFVIPYYFWFVFLIGIQIYGFFFDIPCFEKYMKYTIITYMLTVLIYIIYPTSQNLRPLEFERNNICTWIVSKLYGFDTNTNVCPSIHVIGSLAVYFAARKSKLFGKMGWRIAFFAATVLICASTVFLKQHSIIDVFWGIVLSLVCYPFVYMPKRIEEAAPNAEKKTEQYV